MKRDQIKKESRWYYCVDGKKHSEAVTLEVCLNRRATGECPVSKCKILKERLEMVAKSIKDVSLQEDIQIMCKKLGGKRAKGHVKAVARVTKYFKENIWQVYQS